MNQLQNYNFKKLCLNSKQFNMYIYTNYELEHYEIEYMNMQFMKLYEYVNIWNYTIYIQLWIYICTCTMYISLWINYKIIIKFYTF